MYPLRNVSLNAATSKWCLMCPQSDVSSEWCIQRRCALWVMQYAQIDAWCALRVMLICSEWCTLKVMWVTVMCPWVMYILIDASLSYLSRLMCPWVMHHLSDNLNSDDAELFNIQKIIADYHRQLTSHVLYYKQDICNTFCCGWYLQCGNPHCIIIVINTGIQ